MKTLITSIDISPPLPHVSLGSTLWDPGGFLPLVNFPGCANWTSPSPGLGAVSEMPQTPDPQDTKDSLCVLPRLLGLTSPSIACLSGEALPVSRKTGWFQTICLSAGVTTTIAKWKLRALISFVFLELYCKTNSPMAGQVWSQPRNSL